MSTVTTTTVATTAPDAEMLKNLDLLMDYDMVSGDSEVEFLQDFEDMQMAPSVQEDQGEKK